MLATLFTLALSAADPASALRCDGRLVHPGDYDFQLSQTCGAPFHVERWRELIGQPLGEDAGLARSVDWEEWYYDFGPNRFLQRVRLREGQVQRVELLSLRGRGQPLRYCRSGELRAGLSSGELFALCGAPLRREELDEALRLGRPPGESWIPTRQERWIYRLPNGRLQVFWLRRGAVERIETE